MLLLRSVVSIGEINLNALNNYRFASLPLGAAVEFWAHNLGVAGSIPFEGCSEFLFFLLTLSTFHSPLHSFYVTSF